MEPRTAKMHIAKLGIKHSELAFQHKQLRNIWIVTGSVGWGFAGIKGSFSWRRVAGPIKRTFEMVAALLNFNINMNLVFNFERKNGKYW